MLETVINNLKQRIETLNIFNEINGLCDIITDGDRVFPAEFCNGEYKTVSDFTDNKNGCYFRLNGAIGIEQTEEESSNSCDLYTKKTYQLRLVCFVKKESSYTEEKLILNLEKKISFLNSKELRVLTSMDVVSCTPTGTITDREQLFKDEYNIENKIGYEYAYFALLFDVVIEGNLSCQDLIEC
jgi:hypothetical protein